MAIIKSNKGVPIIVDDNKLEELSKYTWYINPYGYAITHTSKKRHGYTRSMFMHRYLTNAPKGMVVDHLNENKLDNRLENLETVDHRTNVARHYMRKCMGLI